ncbi:hypothetical protein [Variovorax sp. DT-64]|uniref:hypothetical protein n=1 Tax=Variovorax sp. DT-64 TaxID=3396160 RepID=UPI003F1E11DF
MEALTRRFKSSTIFRARKEDDDSSGDEKATKGGGKKVKNLQPPRLKTNWPPHLEKHHKELSDRYPGGDFKTPIKTAINLLHALNLDDVACNVLRDQQVIENMVIELKAKTMRFGEKLSGQGAFLLPVFKLLVKLDVKAAQQFHLLCDRTAKDLLAGTEEYGLIETLPPAQPAFDRTEAKHERTLYIDRVKSTIDGDPKAYGTQLVLLIQGCPPSARDKVLTLLANHKVSTACKKSRELAAHVEKLQGMSPVERGQVDTALALLVLDINLAMAGAEGPGKQEFDFLHDPKIVALFAKVEKGLREQQFDLGTLIATLCPGERTTASQAKFVTGLMGHLTQGAQDLGELFDFQGFLSATLLSGMPGRCAKWLANSAVGTCRTAGDVERLVRAIEYGAELTGMEIAHWHPLGLWANIVGNDIGSSNYIKPKIKADLEGTGLLGQLQQRLQVVEDKSRKSINRLAVISNTSDQMEKDTARSVELATASHTAQRRAKEEKEQQLLENALKSASVEVRSAIEHLGSISGWNDKLSCAKSIADKLQSGELDVQKVAGDFAAIIAPAAMQLMGAVAAILPPDSALALLVAAHKYRPESLHTPEFAEGLVDFWYQARRRMDLGEVAIATDLIDFIAKLRQNNALSSTYFIKIRMEQRIAGSAALHSSPVQDQVTRLIRDIN